MVISKFQNSFSALQAILRYPNSFLGTINDSGILHCTQTIKIINYSVIKCQKNGAKMNKIVQKWQFQKIFYTTMETVLGFSQNRLAELFQNYVFSTIQYLYFDLYVAECQIQFFWPVSWFGVYVGIVAIYTIVASPFFNCLSNETWWINEIHYHGNFSENHFLLLGVKRKPICWLRSCGKCD